MRALAPREVHVRVVPATAAAGVADLLDEGERARAARFASDEHRTLFTAAHGALRVVLAGYLDERPDRLRFAVADLGKPYLVDHPDLSFNLSHSGSMAAVAVAWRRPVGIDIERLRPLRNAGGVARRIMTGDELARYQAAEARERDAFLLRVWARKEALVKASGRGLRESLTTLPSEPGPDAPDAVIDLDVPGYAAAVAAQGHDWDPVVEEAGFG